jgi:hypothetical protein
MPPMERAAAIATREGKRDRVIVTFSLRALSSGLSGTLLEQNQSSGIHFPGQADNAPLPWNCDESCTKQIPGM